MQLPRPGPGPRNRITDVAGLKVGQAEDAAARTGVTVILPEGRALCGCDVRGGRRARGKPMPWPQRTS